MMPTINLSLPVYDDLKALAEPFIDREPQDVIARLIAHWHLTAPKTAASTALVDAEGAAKIFAPDSPPNMAFTRVKSFKMGDEMIGKAELYWNPILFKLVAKAAASLDTDALKKALLVNYVDGKGQEDKGYRFIAEAGLSVQGSDANTVWKAIYALVRAIGMKIEVEFVWEDKPKAAHPNMSGCFSYPGK